MHTDLLMLALILAAALLGGRVASRFGYPSILGEIAAGIILGPPLLGLLSGNEAVDLLGDFGVLLMMLYIGVHLDLGDLKKASRPGLLAAVGGFVVPTGLGIALMLALGRTPMEALFVGLAMGVTSLATKSRILVDLKILDTRIAHVLVAGAVLSDIAVLVIFAAVVGQGGGPGEISALGALATGGKVAAFSFGAWLVGAVLLPRVKTLTKGQGMGRSTALVAVVTFGILFAWAAELAGIHAILGAFIAGLFIDKSILGAKTSKDVQEKLAAISIAILAPFFFVSAGFEVSFSVFTTEPLLLIGVVLLATVGKLVGTAVFYLMSGNGWREGLVVGAGMNGRGAVEIIVAEIALAQGLIDRDVFSVLVFMALFTTATVPVLLTAGVNWLRRRGELVRAGGRNRTLVVGAGPVARAMALGLQVSAVTMIDTNRRNLAAAREVGFETLQGNALDEYLLDEAGIDSASRVIAATSNAEVNALVAHLAGDLGVPEVCVFLAESEAATLGQRLTDDGIEIIRVPDDLSAWSSELAAGTAEVITVDLTEAAEVDDTVPINGAQRVLGSPLLPLIVVSNGERRPMTNLTDVTTVDELVCLRRDAADRRSDKVPAPQI